MTRIGTAQIATLFLLGTWFCAAQNSTKPKITFDSLPDVKLSTTPITLTASVPSGTVTFESKTTDKCTVSDNTLTILAVGQCTITASSTGADSVDRSFNVSIGKSMPGIDTVFGIGSLITANRSDYKINSSTNVLEGSQIGRASPQLLAGVAFQLMAPSVIHPHSKTDHPWHAFVSLKFSTASSQTVVGYTFGVTYRLMQYLDLLIGYALTPFNEPSPGFRAAAVQAVQANLSNKNDPYLTFNGPAMNNNEAGAFDGFPLQVPKNSAYGTPQTSLYAGDALEVHYRGGMMIGISIPVSLNSMLGIKK